MVIEASPVSVPPRSPPRVSLVEAVDEGLPELEPPVPSAEVEDEGLRPLPSPVIHVRDVGQSPLLMGDQEQRKPAKEHGSVRAAHVAAETRFIPESLADYVVEMGGTFEPPQAHGTDQLEPEEVTWKKAADDFSTDFGKREKKIHMLPQGLQGLASRYIIPRAVAIGPYHHRLSHLQQMEKVKRVVAHHFIKHSRHSYEEMYAAVLCIIGDVRNLYANEAMVGIDTADFAIMMFRDGSFLLQYMLICTTDHQNFSPSLLSCFQSNQACINNDIMLLENQIPWLVLETLKRFKPVVVEEFVAKMGRTLQACADMESKPFPLDGYKPPHLLGLLRFYKTQGINHPRGAASAKSKTISAIELKEIGIKLIPSKTTKFVDMGIKEGLLSAKFFLAPLLLDEIRSCWLVNMAAFELCMLADNEIVCSYLAVLAMLMDREEDVHELRSNRLVQGELTNKETLDFFKMLVRHVGGGPVYNKILEEVEAYKRKRRVWIKVHEFVYKNFKAIFTVFSIVGVLVGIFKTLLSLKKR